MTLTSDVADRIGGNRSAAGELTPVELGAWRGFLRVHTALVRELDTELLAAHDLPLSSYDVLIYLQSAPGKRLRWPSCRQRAAEPLGRHAPRRPARARGPDRPRHLRVRRPRLLRRADRRREALLARARPTHLDGVRERFLRQFSDDELEQMAGFWERVRPGAAAGD